MNSPATALGEGLATLGIPASDQQRSLLLAFVTLLAKWNRHYNLTSVTNPSDMVSLHLLDSLAVLPFLTGGRVLDVGTGGGLPGIPLAIMLPDQQFELIDSNAKKTRFVQQAVIELGLKNVRVTQTRVENFQTPDRFDVILCRAFAGLPQIVGAVGPLLAPGGRILAMKGKFPADELHSLHDVNAQTHQLAVPGVGAERHLVEISLEAA